MIQVFFFQIIFRFRLLQKVGYSSLGYTVNPCCLIYFMCMLAAMDCAKAWLRGATPCPRSGATTESARLRRHRSGREELSHVRGQGGGREELPHARGQGSCVEELPHA